MCKKLNQIILNFILTFFTMPLMAETQKWNMAPGVTPVSRDIYDLHMLVLLVVTLIGIAVFGVLIYALFKFRKAKGVTAAGFHENTKLEIILMIIPFIILIIMAVPATKVLMKMEDTSDSTLTIKITGYQWRWEYEYLDQGISFFSDLSTPQEQIENKAPKGQWYLLEVDHPLVVPIHQKIRFLITSNDVIHAWWVPALGIKKDAVPGFIHDVWANIQKPGIYRGQCAELCGANHGFMPIVVEAVTQEQFSEWVKKQQAEATQKTIGQHA